MKDRTAVNHNIRKHFNELIYNTARYTEIVLSIVIIIVIALSGLRLILTTAGTSVMDMDTSFFTSFLSQALSLVVGVEFVKMLCRHSAQKKNRTVLTTSTQSPSGKLWRKEGSSTARWQTRKNWTMIRLSNR